LKDNKNEININKESYSSSKLKLSRFIRHFFCFRWGKILEEKKYYKMSERKFDIFINIKNIMRKSVEVDVLKYLFVR
jgi:hypothetical protein